MTKEEKLLLLYFETCLVDDRGRVQELRMNKEDFSTAKDLDEQGLIRFGRISFDKIQRDATPPRTHWVQFAVKTWEIVHFLRRERAQRYTPTISIPEGEKIKEQANA